MSLEKHKGQLLSFMLFVFRKLMGTRHTRTRRKPYQVEPCLQCNEGNLESTGLELRMYWVLVC